MNRRIYSAEAVILAGGAGNRMGKEYENEQKCLLPIDGEPILGQVLESLSKGLGSAAITICTSHKSAEVYDFVQKNTPKGLDVSFLSDDGISKTTHLYRATKGMTRGSFLGTAGDIVVDPSVYADTYEAIANNSDSIASIAMSPELAEADTHALGKIMGGKAIELTWPPSIMPDKDHLRDMTVWGMNQRFYEYADGHPELGAFPQLLHHAISEGEDIPGVAHIGRWVHVAYPQDLAKTMQ